MCLRWLGHSLTFLTPVRRGVAVVGGLLALAALLMSASGTLTQALSGLRGGGATGYALAPVAFFLTYFVFLAPASLLPGAIARAWRGEGFNKPRKKDASWIVKRLGAVTGLGGGGKAKVGSGPGGALTEEEAAAAAEEEEKEKKQKRMWTIIGFGAMAVSIATGSDVPIFLCFFAQLFKADPSQLMQVMIDKGDPLRAEMDQKLADKAGSIFGKKGKKHGDGEEKTKEEGKPSSSSPQGSKGEGGGGGSAAGAGGAAPA
jgi:hypothetical protein